MSAIGACCRLPGIVRLQPEEIGPMADYLGYHWIDSLRAFCSPWPRRIDFDRTTRRRLRLSGKQPVSVHAKHSMQDFPATGI